MITLRKIRTNDVAAIVRAIYAEETFEFLNYLHQEGGNGLDACVNTTVKNIGKSLFYRVENESGALVGFFTADNIEGKEVMPSFHVRQIYRSSTYLGAFWDLITDTFANSFYTSVGSVNYKAYDHLILNGFEVVNNLEYNGKNFIILLKPNSN